jgi:arylsulfatase A-like enzyme
MTRLLIAARVALLAGASLVPGLVVSATEAAAAPPPNVLIIVTDDQRAGTLGLMRNTVRVFQRNGRSYPRGFVTTPLCCPSRSSIFTGLYAHNHGVLSNSQHGLPQSVTLQRYLHGAGYATAIVGKYLNSWPLKVSPPHFDRWAVGEANTYHDPQFNVNGSIERLRGYSTELVALKAVRFLRSFERADSQPWFLYVAPVAPHLPSTPAAEYAEAAVPGWQRNPAVLEADRRDKPPWVQETTVSHEWIQAKRADQLRTLMSVDDLVGRVARTLGALDERRRTIAVFLSDNGFLWGEHGLKRKDHPYTHSIKVPLLLKWPGHVASGSRDWRYATNVDVAPTILDAASITPAAPMDGRSLLRPWTRRHLLTEFFRPGDRGGVPGWASIRTKRMQYVEYYDAARSHVIFREYYRLDRDPWQLTNLLRDGNPGNDPDVGRLHRLVKHDRVCAGSACP